MANFYERDLWQEARQKTAAPYKGMRNSIADLLFKLKTVSFPGAPTQTFHAPTAIAQRADVVWFPDLNKYRKRALLPYKEAGCKALVFRMGGPVRWVQGNWGYARDETYRPYIEEASQIGMIDQTIGYIVHNPFEGWTTNTATGETVHTELVDEWTSGGYMPRAFCYDHEISKCWTSTGIEINCTAPNLVTSLAENTLNTYKKFKRTVSVYTAKWFANLTAGFWNEHNTYFYNINRPESLGGVGTQRPLWLAWYGQTMSKEYTSMDQVAADLFVPSPEQVGNLLYIGWQANAWQFSSTVKLQGDSIGVDMNISLDPFKLFYYNFGLVEPGTVTPPPPDPEEPPADSDISRRVATLEAQVSDISANVDALLGHQHGAPIL